MNSDHPFLCIYEAVFVYKFKLNTSTNNPTTFISDTPLTKKCNVYCYLIFRYHKSRCQREVGMKGVM